MFFNRIAGDEVVIAAKGDSDGVPSVEPDSIWTQSILLSKGDVRWTIAHYTSADGDSVDFLLNIANADTISDEIKQDLQKMVEFFGLDESALIQLDKNMAVVQVMTLIAERSDYDFQSAMRSELGWLQDNGIIAGITERDIADIASLTKPGSAGWNSRIIYSEDSWRPYYDTDDPDLIRLLFEDASPPEIMETLKMPDGDVAFSTASVTPGGKSITKWGKIKTSF